jgi:hypothetical protein
MMYLSCDIILLPCLGFALLAQATLFPFEEAQLLNSNLEALADHERVLFQPALHTPKYHGANSTCKVFPGDHNWPSDTKWAALNKITNGALIKTIPLAAPCYPGELFDQAKCDLITAQWTNSSLQ